VLRGELLDFAGGGVDGYFPPPMGQGFGNPTGKQDDGDGSVASKRTEPVETRPGPNRGRLFPGEPFLKREA